MTPQHCWVGRGDVTVGVPVVSGSSSALPDPPAPPDGDVRGTTCGNGTSLCDQIQSMWTESMWSKWNPNWSLYLSKPLFSG